MKRGLKNCLLGLLGFSAAPMLTACYGVPYDMADSYYIHGQVVNEAVEPIKNIQVSVTDQKEITIQTDDNGRFDLGYFKSKEVSLEAKDIDGAENGGEFETKTQIVSRELAEQGDVKIVLSSKK